MAFTEQQLEKLKSAIAQGTLEVEYGDKKVKYRSLSEMIQIKNMIERELTSSGLNQSRKLATFSKGVY